MGKFKMSSLETIIEIEGKSQLPVLFCMKSQTMVYSRTNEIIQISLHIL